MRAFALDEFGRPGSVHEVPMPEPASDQVRVKVRGAALNPFDSAVLKGMMKDRIEHHFPLIPGSDLSGTIDAVGAAVDQWKVGDEVFGQRGTMSIGHGSLAEFATAAAATIARRPPTIDPEFGAALPLAGVSALMCVEPMSLKHGDVVVVMGAAGGIGGFAVQIAKNTGATVIAVTRGVNADYVRAFGADEVVDYSTQDVVEAVRKAHPDGVAGVIHTSGDAEELEKLAELVRKGGHITSMRGGAKVEDLAQRSVTGINVRTMVNTAALDNLAAMVGSGALKRPQIKTFKLDQAGAAFEEIGTGHVRGKLVIVP
jgi:NADPH:quinone reductase-like Zn-dependent oxidoreductase